MCVGGGGDSVVLRLFSVGRVIRYFRRRVGGVCWTCSARLCHRAFSGAVASWWGQGGRWIRDLGSEWARGSVFYEKQ